MKNIISKIGIQMLKLISYLPMSFLYFVAYFLYLLLYRVVKYRLKVVRENLNRSFPNASLEELRKTEKQYYQFLSHLVVESVKGFTISEKELRKRITYEGAKYYDELYDNRKSAIVIMGHLGNWEWICRSAPFFLKNKIIVAYKPLTNKGMEKLMFETRTEFGTKTIPMANVIRAIKDEKESFLLILLPDQSPSDSKSSIWVEFLNQVTAVMPGPEKLSKKYNLPVVFHHVTLTKRGHYHCSYKVLVEEEADIQNAQTSMILSQALEQAIEKQKHVWIWSHRRWKLSQNT